MKSFYELFCWHIDDAKIKMPKAMAVAFAQPETDAQRRIRATIDGFTAAETVRLEQGLFEQRKRLADAERSPRRRPQRRQRTASASRPKRSSGR